MVLSLGSVSGGGRQETGLVEKLLGVEKEQLDIGKSDGTGSFGISVYLSAEAKLNYLLNSGHIVHSGSSILSLPLSPQSYNQVMLTKYSN